MAPNRNGNGAGSKSASDKNKKSSSTAAANDEWMKEQTTSTTPAEDETDTKLDSSSSSSSTTKSSSTDTQMELHDYVWVAAAAFVLYKVLATAYDIRLTSIKEYGTVIHEYDPYFNYRATEVSFQSESNDKQHYAKQSSTTQSNANKSKGTLIKTN
jgi:hypothetical protein